MTSEQIDTLNTQKMQAEVIQMSDESGNSALKPQKCQKMLKNRANK